MNHVEFRRSILLAGLILFALRPLAAAEIEVSGLGWFGSRETQRTLRLLIGAQADQALGAPAIEDAALILFHQLADTGYLKPTVTAEIERTDGTTFTHEIHADLSTPLPRPLEAAKVRFKVERGTRYLTTELKFDGLTLMKPDEAADFFVGETMLIPLAADRVYSPAGARQSAGNLEEELRLRGFADAAVRIADEQVDDATGHVRLQLSVHEGGLWRVRELRYEAPAGLEPPAELIEARIGRRWSSLWRQDTMTAIRGWYYERGYPDVSVRLTALRGEADVNRIHPVAVTVVINPGPQVRLGEVNFTGQVHTREQTMRRVIEAGPGELLNPVTLDNSQARLARLGVFNRVGLRYEPAGENVRDATFVVSEGRRQEVNLLAGYGSYEQLRGGVEWNHYNLWGRAHSHTLRLVQSMKSSAGDYRYTVPDIFGTKINGSARLFGLRREELSFVREEYGANLSLARPLESLGATGTLTYTFRRVRNTRNELATNPIDETQANVASIDFRLNRDKRDNPLSPRRGHRLFVQLEEASKVLGGEVDYQQFLVGASYHTAWGRSRWIHLGLEHGVLTTFGADNDTAVPVSARFFPGGDGSIRGYNRGEAAPRAANGLFVGAKSYLQLNVELEQALTPKLSAVVFVDGLGMTARLADYPFDETLFSAGVGLRYHTLIGPVRLEYGHNLNPRPLDPRGTLLLSVGFPF